MVLRPANNDISKWHFTGFPQRAAQPLLSVPATVLRLPLVGTRRAGKDLGVPYEIAARRCCCYDGAVIDSRQIIHVRRGRPLTSQTAFGGQLPYEGSLGRPAVNNGGYT